MRGLFLNTLLAVVWALFSGEFSLRELAIGFLAGFVLLSLFPSALGSRHYVQIAWGLLRFLGFFVRELLVANIQVALLALRLQPNLNGMIFSVPLRVQSEVGQTLLVSIVTLLPGSVVLGFSSDRRRMYVHAIGLESTQEARASIIKVEDALLGIFPNVPQEANA